MYEHLSDEERAFHPSEALDAPSEPVSDDDDDDAGSLDAFVVADDDDVDEASSTDSSIRSASPFSARRTARLEDSAHSSEGSASSSEDAPPPTSRHARLQALREARARKFGATNARSETISVSTDSESEDHADRRPYRAGLVADEVEDSDGDDDRYDLTADDSENDVEDASEPEAYYEDTPSEIDE